jgi:predicted enzyme related to lactoylglutathione lyase
VPNVDLGRRLRTRIVRNGPYGPGMAIARFPSLVLDCPDPATLATFYGRLLGWEVSTDDDWAEVRAEHGQCVCFQQVADYTAPRWPGQDVPQQMHLDVIVDDLDEAEQAVLALGAMKAAHQPGSTFRVFLDPAGHPFCCCTS